MLFLKFEASTTQITDSFDTYVSDVNIEADVGDGPKEITIKGKVVHDEQMVHHAPYWVEYKVYFDGRFITTLVWSEANVGLMTSLPKWGVVMEAYNTETKNRALTMEIARGLLCNLLVQIKFGIFYDEFKNELRHDDDLINEIGHILVSNNLVDKMYVSKETHVFWPALNVMRRAIVRDYERKIMNTIVTLTYDITWSKESPSNCGNFIQTTIGSLNVRSTVKSVAERIRDISLSSEAIELLEKVNPVE